MKQTIIALVTMVSGLSAMACPQLAGNYRCSVGIFAINVPVSQSSDRGVTTYVLDGAPIVADGKRHQAETLPQLMARYVEDVTYVATCSGSNLNFEGDGKTIRDGNTATVRGTLTKQSENKLAIAMNVQSSNGTKNFNATCTKQ